MIMIIVGVSSEIVIHFALFSLLDWFFARVHDILFSTNNYNISLNDILPLFGLLQGVVIYEIV